MTRNYGRNKKIPISNKDIIDLYETGISLEEVAKKLGIWRRTVYRRMKQENYKVRPQSMETHSCWKGGRQLVNGYPCYRDPKHPRAKSNGYVFYHHIVAEKMVGHTLTKSNPIHHIDFNKLNYNKNNLYICDGESEHRRLHTQLENIARDLFHKGVIIFKDGNYLLKDNYK